MKKRILLSLVSFFMMTAMWASLIDAYQIYVTAAAPGKTNATAELTLNLKNNKAVATWQCSLVLPAGVTAKSVVIVDGRYPEGYNANITLTPDNSIVGKYMIACNGAEGVALTGTDGAVATVTVEVAATATLGEALVVVEAGSQFYGPADENYKDTKERVYTWTIEKGEDVVKGDINGDGNLNVADAQTALIMMADGQYSEAADLNHDGFVNVADAQMVLILMADQ